MIRAMRLAMAETVMKTMGGTPSPRNEKVVDRNRGQSATSHSQDDLR